MKQVSIVLLVVLTLGVSLGSVSALETQWPTAQERLFKCILSVDRRGLAGEFEILRAWVHDFALQFTVAGN